jgi:hypothetical protein
VTVNPAAAPTGHPATAPASPAASRDAGQPVPAISGHASEPPPVRVNGEPRLGVINQQDLSALPGSFSTIGIFNAQSG